MAANETIKALECCTIKELDCADCPNKEQGTHCIYVVMKSALDLINLLKSENERLNSDYEKLYLKYENALNGLKYYKRLCKTSKSKVRKEFAEQLKQKFKHCNKDDVFSVVAYIGAIDGALEEMENENDER